MVSTGPGVQCLCGVCGTPCKPRFQAPPAELAPDLDGRPGEPARSTLPRWIATCRDCGASAPDLAALPRTVAGLVQSDAYRALGSAFLRWADVAEHLGDKEAAAEAVLQAAWVLDDAQQDAAPLRRRAAALWGGGDPFRRLDILRRAGEFTQAEALAATLGPLGEEAGRILDFQRHRIAARDAGRHMISSALRPPARTPHATHGRAAPRPGLWARLFGR